MLSKACMLSPCTPLVGWCLTGQKGSHFVATAQRLKRMIRCLHVSIHPLPVPFSCSLALLMDVLIVRKSASWWAGNDYFQFVVISDVHAGRQCNVLAMRFALWELIVLLNAAVS